MADMINIKMITYCTMIVIKMDMEDLAYSGMTIDGTVRGKGRQ